MSLSVVLLVFFLYQLSFSSSTFLCPKYQSISLLKFKETLTITPNTFSGCYIRGQKPYPKTSSWNMSSDCCSWDGVVCDEMTGHVIELDLSCSGLVGNIDSNSSLFQLSHLQSLNLSYNYFHGSHISPEFGKFSSLTHLDLSDTFFSGQIPSEISHLSKLHFLRLHGNDGLRLVGNDFILLLQNLTELRELDLTFVNIFSTIPLNFSSHLTTLRLAFTGLYGMIPESIFQLPNLETLDLSNTNELSGHFPKIKWNSSASLKVLDLGHVNFSDNFAESIGYLTSLQTLSLRYCNLRGPVPEFLSNLTRIEILDLSDNSLNGTIPSVMLSHPSLTYLYLSNNHFSGQLEDFKSNSLVVIDLSNNQLQGHLPNSIQDLVNLTVLDLSFNSISGSVDVSLFSDLKQLNSLILSYNNISLTNEKEVKSTLPESLIVLELAACEVKELEFLRSAKNLWVLDISNNKIQGRIPDWAWPNWMVSLQILDLGDNHLNDTFPMWLGTLPKLKLLSLRSNKLHGSIKTLTTQNLFPQLIILDLSSNAFTKNLPTNMGDLIALRVLNISHNGLEGPIPPSLGSLSSVESLDLSSNHLTGEIPAELASLVFLAVLNLSYNHLEGCIPQGAQFRTFEINSYEGNDGLRGFPVSKGCGNDHVSGTNDTVSGQLDDEESNSKFWGDFWKASLMGYGSGLCIGLSIIYFMISSGKPIWLARLIVALEHKLMMGRRKKQRRQRNYRRRNNQS